LISKQKKIDEELSQAIIKAENATATAEHAVIAKATILSNMSHEIRTECDNWLYQRFIENRFIRKQTECLQAIQSSGGYTYCSH
jgi:signal transduction histidine kinase